MCRGHAPHARVESASGIRAFDVACSVVPVGVGVERGTSGSAMTGGAAGPPRACRAVVASPQPRHGRTVTVSDARQGLPGVRVLWLAMAVRFRTSATNSVSEVRAQAWHTGSDYRRANSDLSVKSPWSTPVAAFWRPERCGFGAPRVQVGRVRRAWSERLRVRVGAERARAGPSDGGRRGASARRRKPGRGVQPPDSQAEFSSAGARPGPADPPRTARPPRRGRG